MKPLYWDSNDPSTGLPLTWDSPNPNVTWDGILEPGDPGYTPPSPPDHPPPAKPKRMKRQAYYPTSVAEQIIWLENFRNKLTSYAVALGLTSDQVSGAVADARWIMYVLGSWLPAVRAWSKACTDAAAEAQSADGSTLIALPVFTPPVLPTGVVPVNTGALDRVFAMVQTVKEKAGFTEAIGTDLGVLGSQQSGPDLTTVQPVITATVSGSTVLIGWGWGGNRTYLDMCELQVGRGQGWQMLAFDTTPNYTDTAPFPATPTKWKYRAIYRVGDAQVGLWSTEVSVTVGG